MNRDEFGRTWWDKFKFKLFGDGKVFIIALYIPVFITLLVLFVIGHFIIKYW